MAFIPLAEPWIDATCVQAVNKQVASGFIGPGETTALFARRLAELVSTQHCVPTTSRTIALGVAANALGLKPGYEIIVPAYGVISTINAFASAISRGLSTLIPQPLVSILLRSPRA